MVQTKSINILNLCVPCENHCRYCLLSWNGNCLGIDYERSVKYARKFHEWLNINHPDMGFMYYYGYSMEHPQLLDTIKFMQETNSPGGEFLQFDGMKMRTKEQLFELLTNLKNEGIKLLDFTFYGLQEYHDKFAGRIGDYELMMNSLEIALRIGLDVEVGIPVTKENLSQLDELVNIFENKKVRLFMFTPHSGGRGISLQDVKITVRDYDNLSDRAKKYFNRDKNRTPKEWYDYVHEDFKNRVLTISLLPSNIDKLENQSFEETIKELERMDDEFYKVVPSFVGLLKNYVDENDTCLYSLKDLNMIYRNRFINDNHLDIVDITDVRFSGSIRF